MHTFLTDLGTGAFAPQVTAMIRKIKCLILQSSDLQPLDPDSKESGTARERIFVLIPARSCWQCWCPQFQWYTPDNTHLFSREHTFRWWFIDTPISRHERVLLAFPGRCYKDSNPCAYAIAQF
jgi:hypothetical protein